MIETAALIVIVCAIVAFAAGYSLGRDHAEESTDAVVAAVLDRLIILPDDTPDPDLDDVPLIRRQAG